MQAGGVVQGLTAMALDPSYGAAQACEAATGMRDGGRKDV